MRFLVVFSVVGLAALLICVTLLVFFRSKVPPLTVVPTGQPRFRAAQDIFGASTQVYLSVAVTNNTQSSLVGHVTVTARDNPTPFFDGNDFFNLSPRSGMICTVRYHTNPPTWILGADYMKVRSPAEVKLRSFLFWLGVPGVTTNYDWNFLVVGQIVQH